jgi:hypothetical protein
MKKSSQKKVDEDLTRREFMKHTGLITLGGLGCLALGGLREAIARAKVTGKPVLTDASLNQFIRTNAATWSTYQRLAGEAKGSLLLFLNKYFTLTPAQAAAVKTMTSANLATFQTAINSSLKDRKPFTVAFIGTPVQSKEAGGSIKVTVTYKHNDSSGGSGGGSSSDEVSGSVEAKY